MDNCSYTFDYEAYMGNVAFCLDDYIEALDGYTGLLCLIYPAECAVSRCERTYGHIAGKCSYITPNHYVDPAWIDTLKDCSVYWHDEVTDGDICKSQWSNLSINRVSWYKGQTAYCLDPAMTPYLNHEDERIYRASIGQRVTCCQGYIESKATIGRSTIDLGDYPGYPVYSAIDYTDNSPVYNHTCLHAILMYCKELRLCSYTFTTHDLCY